MVHIIPLGFHCYVADNLRKMNIRKTAYPFDWIWPSYEYLLNVIKLENNEQEIDKFFNNYFSKDNFDINKCKHNDGSSFPHESSPKSWIWNKNAIPKYIRRTKRLLDVIDNSKEIIFISGDAANKFSDSNNIIVNYSNLMATIIKRRRKFKHTYFITFNIAKFNINNTINNHIVDIFNGIFQNIKSNDKILQLELKKYIDYIKKYIQLDKSPPKTRSLDPARGRAMGSLMGKLINLYN